MGSVFSNDTHKDAQSNSICYNPEEYLNTHQQQDG